MNLIVAVFSKRSGARVEAWEASDSLFLHFCVAAVAPCQIFSG